MDTDNDELWFDASETSETGSVSESSDDSEPEETRQARIRAPRMPIAYPVLPSTERLQQLKEERYSMKVNEPLTSYMQRQFQKTSDAKKFVSHQQQAEIAKRRLKKSKHQVREMIQRQYLVQVATVMQDMSKQHMGEGVKGLRSVLEDFVQQARSNIEANTLISAKQAKQLNQALKIVLPTIDITRPPATKVIANFWHSKFPFSFESNADGSVSVSVNTFTMPAGMTLTRFIARTFQTNILARKQIPALISKLQDKFETLHDPDLPYSVMMGVLDPYIVIKAFKNELNDFSAENYKLLKEQAARLMEQSQRLQHMYRSKRPFAEKKKLIVDFNQHFSDVATPEELQNAYEVLIKAINRKTKSVLKFLNSYVPKPIVNIFLPFEVVPNKVYTTYLDLTTGSSSSEQVHLMYEFTDDGAQQLFRVDPNTVSTAVDAVDVNTFALPEHSETDEFGIVTKYHTKPDFPGLLRSYSLESMVHYYHSRGIKHLVMVDYSCGTPDNAALTWEEKRQFEALITSSGVAGGVYL